MSVLTDIGIFVAGLVLAFFIGWFYRAHVDAQNVLAAQATMAAQVTAKVLKATQEADAKTAALQEAADAHAATLQGQLDAERKANAQAIRKAHAQLAAAGTCAVPVAALGVLDPGASVPGGSAGAAPAGAGPPNPPIRSVAATVADGGTIACSAVIENAERARGAFDRNLARLQSCIASYDAAASAVGH